jgi:hypothetical protein
MRRSVRGESGRRQTEPDWSIMQSAQAARLSCSRIVRKAFRREGGAEPPLDFENTFYTARIAGGTEQITELALDKPGKYALLCFVSDRKGGPPHVAQGMIAEITVR